MKKNFLCIVTFVCALFFMLNTNVVSSNAAEPANERLVRTQITPINELYYAETRIYEQRDALAVYAASQTVSPYGVCDITDGAGNLVARYTLYCTFTYNGTTSSCTSATYSTNVYSSFFSFTSASAAKGSCIATGMYTVKCSFPSYSFSDSITIKCDKNGVIS